MVAQGWPVDPGPVYLALDVGSGPGFGACGFGACGAGFGAAFMARRFASAFSTAGSTSPLAFAFILSSQRFSGPFLLARSFEDSLCSLASFSCTSAAFALAALDAALDGRAWLPPMLSASTRAARADLIGAGSRRRTTPSGSRLPIWDRRRGGGVRGGALGTARARGSGRAIAWSQSFGLGCGLGLGYG